VKHPLYQLLFTVVIALFSGVGCQSKEASSASPAKGGGPDRDRPVWVKVEPLSRGAVTRRLQFVGELVAEETVEVAAKLAGRLKSVRVRLGDAVKKGDLLVKIEDSHLRAQQKESKAALAVARAAISRAEAQEENAVREVARKAPLIERDLVTQQEMDNLRSRKATEAAALALARAQTSQAEARIEILSTQLKDTVIRAPFTGRVAARYMDPGAVVNPGSAILQIIDADPIIARFKVQERFLGTILDRMAAEEPLDVDILLDAFPDRSFEGRVVRVSPALDKATRSAVVEAEVQDTSGRAAPGMYCRVVLDLGRREDALLLPATALLEASEKAVLANGSGAPREARVWVVEMGRAHQRKVSLGALSDGRYELIDGLSPDAVVVVEGANLVKEGAQVKVAKDRAPKGRGNALPASAGGREK
jgi:RND family efflux transporter MFP subunit